MANKKNPTTAKVTKVTEANAQTKETLRAEIDSLVKDWNESAEFSEFKIMRDLDAKIADKVSDYTLICETDCFNELRDYDNVMLEAAKRLTFDTITAKEKREMVDGKETGRVLKVVEPAQRRIDPLRLHKKVEGGIGADSLWYGKVERLNMLLTAATALELKAHDGDGKKLDLKTIRDTAAMSDEARKITLAGEDKPKDDKVILADLQTVIDAMLGEGYKATPEMVVYLRKTHEKGGKAAMSVVCSNAKTMRQYVLDVCHAAITGKGFLLDYKKRK